MKAAMSMERRESSAGTHIVWLVRMELREDKGESRMITVPVYNMIILPNISLTFKKDFFDDASTTDIHEGDDVLFVFQKESKKKENLTKDDFYPIGVSGRVQSVDSDGDVTIETLGLNS